MRRVGITRHLQWGLLFSGLWLNAPLPALDLEGTSAWGNRLILSTTVSGMVDKVHVESGEEVTKGSLLVELDQRHVRKGLAAAQSRLDASRQLNQEAQRELDRTLELYDRTLISEHERKLAEIEAVEADARFREAQADLTAMRLRQEFSTIAAPFSGLVLEIHVQPGQAVVNRFAAEPLVTLVEHSRMRAQAQIDAATLAALKLGDRVQVGVRGIWLEGTISHLGFEPLERADKGSSYLLEAQFTPQRTMGLRAGERLVIRLPDE